MVWGVPPAPDYLRSRAPMPGIEECVACRMG